MKWDAGFSPAGESILFKKKMGILLKNWYPLKIMFEKIQVY